MSNGKTFVAPGEKQVRRKRRDTWREGGGREGIPGGKQDEEGYLERRRRKRRVPGGMYEEEEAYLKGRRRKRKDI